MFISLLLNRLRQSTTPGRLALELELALELALEFELALLLNYLSASPITGSILPIIATTSETICPFIRCGSDCRLPSKVTDLTFHDALHPGLPCKIPTLLSDFQLQNIFLQPADDSKVNNHKIVDKFFHLSINFSFLGRTLSAVCHSFTRRHFIKYLPDNFILSLFVGSYKILERESPSGNVTTLKSISL